MNETSAIDMDVSSSISKAVTDARRAGVLISMKNEATLLCGE